MHEQLKVYEEKMQKTMKSLDSDLAAIRAGRANPHILDRYLLSCLLNRH